MAKQVKVTMGTSVVYPQTITDAIADVSHKAKLSDIITELEGADVISENVTATVNVGKVTSGSTFEAGTNVKDIVSAILSFASPAFSTLKINDGTKDYAANASLFCASTEWRLASVKHSESNVGSIKDGTITLSVNGTTSTTAASSTEVTAVREATLIPNTNKKSFYVELTGKNTLGAAMAAKRVTLTWYMPVYCFVTANQTESTIKEALNNATAETTVYTGVHTIDKTTSFSAGGAWCVALPSHLAMTGIGTQADFGFGTQKTETTTYTATRTVNGIAGVPYTIYVLPIDTAQTNLPVRITLKTA